ncbi:MULTISPECIES: peptide ABC transporter substrate-binding protein [Halomonas]|uniref:peptide ABC transporter substrate-binding protein n=1 Tax=Halomonas TaxID=2745 RepID=UPI001A8F84AF|nr:MULTISPECIES: peptide ABC transporter substrate-binding protein [Halomonas]MED5297116.1 peptide ABC transporter substrate-binding protein [Pseudomonadota bacterium]MBN8411882.1 peptide ABC transporter substrate-binding protein [Halomonas litopenaei]MBY5970103.1 peptide ABC transporter substrate-binding protein [Halomonas denitrificans]MBY5985514.1 peptide ABC transporter substrate-binding protein [Halomonas sp. DP5Y7-2]MBY6209897.1 peptide ABC transporter substrate-binding protein [Halomona
MIAIRPRWVRQLGLASGLTLSTLAAVIAAPAMAETLDLGVTGELASFDTSQISGGIWESQILMDVYEGLVKKSPEGKVLPGMASDWQVSEDGKTWTFSLREDARWSDGEPVTAEDFVFGWRHLLDPANASKYAYMLYPLVNAREVNTGELALEELGVESRDDGRTLVVQLNQSTPYFLQLLTHYTAYPQPQHTFEQYGKEYVDLEHIVTNGAFTPTEWISQSRITTVKNPEYYEADQVALDGVRYHTIEDRNAGVSRFRAGELDIMREYSSSMYPLLKEEIPEATHMATYLGSYYYVFNHRDGHPTADPRVREALNMAVRRDVIADNIMGGTFQKSLSFVPDGIDHYQVQNAAFDDAEGNDITGDLNARMARAKELLEDAGYDQGNPLTLRLRYNTTDEHKKIAVAVSSMWRPLGVEVELVNAEATVHYQTIAEGDFDVARAGWIADYNDAENFLALLRSGVGNNYGAYANEAFDTLYDEAATTLDLDERKAILERAEALAMDDDALIPMLYYVSRNLVNPAISGWEDNIEDDHPSRWVSFEE